MLPLLDLLSTPKSFEEIIAADLSIEEAERGPLLRLLLRTGAIETTRPRQPRDGDAWWDPRDRARYEVSVLSLIQVAHGFSKSAQVNMCVDHWGRPVPWLARPVVDFLHQLDLAEAKVFEFGGGASTWYWARRCRSVTCAESNPDWHERLRAELGDEVELLLRRNGADFANAILETDRRYDLILIDAAPAFRSGCVGPALRRLAPGGMIILDDAPFYPEAAGELRAAGLIEVDMTGYSPLEDNLQTTALFFRRDFDMRRRTIQSPTFPFGSPHYRWGEFRADLID